MDQVSKALSATEIAAIEARQNPNTEPAKVAARQVMPNGVEAERVIRLAVPVEFGGTVHTEVSVRRLKGRDFRALQSMAGDENIALLGIVTGLPVEVIDELDAEDFVALSEAAQDFLPRALREAVDTTSAGGQGSQP